VIVLEAGVAKVCISPRPGARLAGFAARQDVCRGVHDDLYARALVLRSAQEAAAIVSVDVLALPGAFVERLREKIARKTGLPARCVMIACTHTHAAPVTITTFFNPGEEVDPQYMESLASAIEQSVENAWRGRFAAAAGTGSAKVRGIAVNRRSHDGLPVDEEAGILRIDDDRGRIRAVLMNFACHPTVLGPDNLLASGDFPAAAIDRIEALHGAAALFVNGAEGDVSVGHSSELSAIGVIASGRTFERAGELGRRLADAVSSELDGIATSTDPLIRVEALTIDLPRKQFASVGQTRSDLDRARQRLSTMDDSTEEYRHAKSELLYASITDFYAAAEMPPGNVLRVELQGVRIGEAMFVAVPAEVFVELELQMKHSARARLFLVGIANGYIAYLPDRNAYANGGYEVVSAQVDETAGERLVDGVLEVERRLFT
jgi:neutral ceramidase